MTIIENGYLGRADWITDNKETMIEFSIKKFWGLITVNGQMQVRQGRLEMDSSGVGQGSAYIEIEANSAVTGNARRDKHLKTADFFEVERFPLIIFRSQSAEQIDEMKFRLMGALTIRDITRPVTLEVSQIAIQSEGNVNFQATTTFMRQDFGLNFKKMPIGNEVVINLKIKAVQPSPLPGKASSKY